MKICILLLIVVCISSQRLLKQETLEQVKTKANWESYNWDENPFKDYTHDQLHSILGTTLMWDKENVALLVDNDDHNVELPKEFDSRKQWSGCVFSIRDQQHCGSCWAFSAAEVLGDRFCIKSGGKIKEILSPQDMVSCSTNNHACQGGMLDATWNYLEESGITTDECTPYVSGDGKNVPHCSHGTCSDKKLKYTKYRAVSGSSQALTCATQMKQEIMKNGPVQTGFIVYEDFMHYKSGVYKHTHGEQLGGHAVKVVGWGEEDGQKYFIAQNSWGPNWAENGFFRIGEGECLFAENGYVGEANVDEFSFSKAYIF
jgi:cathepsin B